jgi:hypothetical protein
MLTGHLAYWLEVRTRALASRPSCRAPGNAPAPRPGRPERQDGRGYRKIRPGVREEARRPVSSRRTRWRPPAFQRPEGEQPGETGAGAHVVADRAGRAGVPPVP